MRPFLALLFLCLAGTCVRAQTLSGRVLDDETGEPLPFASVYVAGTKSGAAANAEGYYEVKLAPGDNQVVFQYLGYQPLTKRVRGTTELDVRLQAEALKLDEVEILSGGEDRSYSVIRRAIAKADYHRNQVDSFTSEVYIKGTGKVTEVGGLINMLAGKEGREEIDEMLNKSFTTESISEVSYVRPNTFRERVLQSYSIGEEGFDANQYFFTNFYQPEVNGAVSPLHPRAFAYYKYELLGVSVEDDELVHKIRVIPRSKGEDVFTGTLYVVDGDWAIHGLDLTTQKFGFKIRIKQNYAEVQTRVWMPVTTTLNAEGSILGISFVYDYLSTSGKYRIHVNEELPSYVEVIDEKTQPEAAAAVTRTARNTDVDALEEQLGDGEKITRKDFRKLMKAYAEAERRQQEEPEVVSNYSYRKDSVNVVRDTALWAALRPVPLTAAEVEGYARRDSFYRADSAEAARRDSLGLEEENDEEDDAQLGWFSVDEEGNAKFGRPYRPEQKYALAFKPTLLFNPVEGYVVGARVGVKGVKQPFNIGLSPRYGFGWKQLLLDGDVQLGKSGVVDDELRNEPLIQISGGRGIRQFNDLPAISPWLNTITTLTAGDNYIHLYRRDYGQVDVRYGKGERFGGHARLRLEDAEALQNSANNNWSGLDDGESYAANAPDNNKLGRVTEVGNMATAAVSGYWRPGLKYRIVNGEKSFIPRTAPTLRARVEQSLPGMLGNEARFTHLQASYEHRFNVGRALRLDVLYRGGVFLNNENMSFPDFRHFAGAELALIFADPLANYRLLDYYLESTNEQYFEAFTHVQFRKFLLTRINYLHLKGLREDLFVNYLYTPTSDHYTELGYTLDNIFRFLRVEFVTSFRDGRYEDFGVRIGVSTNLDGMFGF